MRSFVAFRLTSQICFASAVVCMFPLFGERWFAFALFAGLSFVAGLCAGEIEKPLFRFAFSLLPLASLFFAGRGWMAPVALLLLLGYELLFLSLGRFQVELWYYRPAVGVLCIVLLILILSGLGTVTSDSSRYFALAGLLLSLLALRTLRLGPAPSLGWQAGNAGLFLLPLSGGIATGAVLCLIGSLFQYLVYAVAAVSGAVVAALAFLGDWIMKIFTNFEDPYDTATTEYTTLEAASEELISEGLSERSISLRQFRVQIPWNSLVTVLSVVAVIALIVFLLRRGARASGKMTQDSGLTEDGYFEEGTPRRRGRKKTVRRTYREKIRGLYRDYLTLLRHYNIYPKESATTLEISDSAASVLLESDEKLRDLYRRCRYSDAPVTKEDFLAAEKAFNDIRSMIGKTSLDSSSQKSDTEAVSRS